MIANALKTNAVCIELNMRGNNIRADGAAAISAMLKVNRSLRKLSLEWNCLGIWESSLQALSDSITVNNTLDDLDLRNNRINPQGIAILATGIRHNTSLKKLGVYSAKFIFAPDSPVRLALEQCRPYWWARHAGSGRN